MEQLDQFKQVFYLFEALLE